MNKLGYVAIGSLAILVLAACASSGSSQNLTGNIWQLYELNGGGLIEGTMITAQFDNSGRLSGTSGCNNYNTSYEVNGNQITFSEPVGMTMMACPEPIMEQERDYMVALSETVTFEIDGDELAFKNTAGDDIARFSAVDQSLQGTSWQVLSYNNGKGGVTSLIIGTEISANFGDDDQVSGNSGCNQYFGQYKTDGNNIDISGVGATEMACLEPEGVMDQEQEYLAALETAATFKIEGLNMEMRTADGAMVATFQRDPDQ